MTDPLSAGTSAEDGPALGWRAKAGYGAVDLGLAAVESLVQIYLLKFYNVVIGLPSTLAGVALALAILWDAVSDPVMGGISDRTRLAGGRRRPFFVPGATTVAVAFILLYNPPALTQTAIAFAWLLGTFILLNTGMTVVGVPHFALGGEITFDRHQRTQLFAYKRLFAVLGVLAGTLTPALVLAHWSEGSGDVAVAESRSLTSLLLAVPIVFTAWFSSRATRGLDSPAPPDTDRQPFGLVRLWQLFADQRHALANPLFVPLLVGFIIAAVGRTINASVALYYYEYRLELTEQQAVVGVLLPFFLCFLASMPAWVWLSRRYGKRLPAMVGVIGLGATTAVVYPIFPVGQLAGPFAYSIIGGALGGAIVLLDSMVADSVDYDLLKSRRNREGLYFGVWKMGTKVSRAFGLVLAGVLLDLIGFDQAAGSASPEVAQRLAWIFGPAVGALFVAAGLVLWRMPLTDGVHQRVQNLLRRRRRREAERGRGGVESGDRIMPVTGAADGAAPGGLEGLGPSPALAST